jgi:hypothetical protein
MNLLPRVSGDTFVVMKMGGAQVGDFFVEWQQR